ncbi:MAG: hypothetical protein GVY36_20270 [Verrucomicrobia bacterium]|jgi:hypothetical protein|nr:hypothetical protein [Verrucomicrobiota bacterium]
MGYTELAERAAHSVKENCPGLEVDLFTDQPVEMPVFDRIHQLDDPWHGSKMDAMALSRFDKTLYLDADLLVIADIRDVFEVLNRFDMAMAHDPIRNGERCNTFWRKSLPNAVPQFNGGVVAFRRSPGVVDLIKNWSTVVRENDFQKDQPVLRELVWDSDLRIATLPSEYNLMRFKDLHLWRTHHAAPRIIHSPQFHKHFTKNKKKRLGSLEDLLGPVTASKLPLLISADRSLARMAGRAPHLPTRKEIWLRRLRLMWHVPTFWARRLF